MFKSIGVLAMLPLLFWILDSTEAKWTSTLELKGIETNITQTEKELKCMLENCEALTSCTCKCMCVDDGKDRKNGKMANGDQMTAEKFKFEKAEFKNCKVQCWMSRLCKIPCQMTVDRKPADCNGKCKGWATAMVEGMNDGNPAKAKKNYEKLLHNAQTEVAKLPRDCLTKRTAFKKAWKRIDAKATTCD